LKHNISITLDSKLFREIEELRGLSKRSTFMEHLLREGLKAYKCKERAAVAKALKTPRW
jgi:metal-responsive CopG/Arc/MetJ family transcriptional regulator